MQLSEIFKDSNHSLALFDDKEVKKFEKKIKTDTKNGKDSYTVECIVRKKNIQLKPEEVVRQLYIQKLIKQYGYDLQQFDVQCEVQMGTTGKRADIVIFERDRVKQPYIIVELKSPANPTAKEGKKQLESYCKFAGASIGIWTDGNTEEFYYKKENTKTKTTYLDKLTEIPHANQTLSDILNIQHSIKHLFLNDKLKERSLKDIILEFEDVVLANSGVDSFEEIFKLLFTKLYDEYMSGEDADEIDVLLRNKNKLEDIDDTKFRSLQFRNTGTETETFKRITSLFDEAKTTWSGIFSNAAKLELNYSHLNTCVSYLQDIKLFNSNLEVVDDAFEYLVTKEQKGDKGQYFTPRYVIDMCVKMLNPNEKETMIDPAAGSCGFPMHTVMHVWGKINPNKPNMFSNTTRSKKETNYVRDKIFAIDFDRRSVRVGRMLNIIAGDGHTNVLLLNTLDYTRWEEVLKDRSWLEVYNDGFRRLEKLQSNSGSNEYFNCNIVMANPPFAGDITDEQILSNYKEIAPPKSGKSQKAVGRDILFIERNLNFLKPGGRMAIVLPQGRFNNSSDKNIREFIAERCRILAVIGLHGNTFKPHTGTKTSVLFVQKWDEKLCPKKDDYNIFFAMQQLSGKDNSGEKLYWKSDISGSTASLKEALRDKHGHPIVWHDLFGIDKKTPPGIAEAFIEFAKKERLSFF